MFFNLVKQALLQRQPNDKIQMVNELHSQLVADALNLTPAANIEEIIVPGRPDKPVLVHPSQVARRKLSTEAGRVALIHAVCHIEFNAINLALDAAYRFQSLPRDYYLDWMRVAVEESKHFSLLCGRLHDLDCHYGDYSAHNGLWEMAVKTQHSLVERMALVPRVLEARGLDVTPGMIDRLNSVGDSKTVAILEVILRDEVSHVEIGSNWFRYACAQEGLVPESTFVSLLKKYKISTGRGPLHIEARKQAGFHAQELDALGEVSGPS